MAERPRVVVTGLGLVSPLGNSVEGSWKRMLKGEHGITLLDPPFRYRGEDKVFVAAPVTGFSQAILSAKEAERRSHLSQLYSLVATAEALVQAGLWVDGKLPDVKPEDIGAKIGTGFGGAREVIEVHKALEGDVLMRQIYSLIVQPERVATVPSMAFLLRNSAHATIAACATGGVNIIEAYNRIALGQAQVMAAGSTEALIKPEAFVLYGQIRALSGKKDPDFASTPFDKGRDGFVIGEGAGILVLENLEHAMKRGAKPIAELVGVADTADAKDATAPSTEGQTRAMRKALIWAGLEPQNIDYISAHGTGTSEGDETELESIMEVFGEFGHTVPVSSLKWQLAHMLGASSSAETVFSIQMMQEGVIIPNFGLRDPLRDDINLITKPQFKEINAFMKNTFGFGGINAVLIFRRYN